MNSQTIATADWHETLYRWLSAPLLLTVIGALLINYLIPEITAKSQRSKEALETKASIVRDMTQATTAAVGTSRLVAMDVIKKEEVEEERRNATQQAAFNEGLQSWELDSADIGSRLEAYFRKTSPTVSSEWRGGSTPRPPPTSISSARPGSLTAKRGSLACRTTWPPSDVRESLTQTGGRSETATPSIALPSSGRHMYAWATR